MFRFIRSSAPIPCMAILLVLMGLQPCSPAHKSTVNNEGAPWQTLLETRGLEGWDTYIGPKQQRNNGSNLPANCCCYGGAMR